MPQTQRPFPRALVAVFAARNPADVVGKLGCVVLAVNALNLLEARFVASSGGSPFLEEVQAATLVSLPFLMLAMLLLTHLDRLQADLRVMAETDMLTGLPNRRAFFNAVSALNRKARSAVVILADIDPFKRINDTHGHQTGDICLRHAADALRRWLPADGVICRFGGEEFAMVILGRAPGDILHLGRDLAEGISFCPAGTATEVRMTLSAGAAFWPKDQPIDTALCAADRALYDAKAAGRARLCCPVAVCSSDCVGI